MKGLKSFALIFIMSISTLVTQAQPYFKSNQDPKPTGKSWQMVNSLSDNFDGNGFDYGKWEISHGNSHGWEGRPPGLFQNWTVSEGQEASTGNGCLKIANYWLTPQQQAANPGFKYAAGSVWSKQKAKPGYYMECRMKASQTFMSSTFWLVSRCVYTGNTSYPKKRRTELDIQETVGKRTTGHPNFPKTMNSHTHNRKSNDCNNENYSSRQGSEGLGGQSSSKYYVYGAWWKSPNEILFYLNGEYVYTLYPHDQFNLDMHLRMVSETYDWNDDIGNTNMNLATHKRTVYYDWVRTWKLVGNGGGSNGGAPVGKRIAFRKTGGD